MKTYTLVRGKVDNWMESLLFHQPYISWLLMFLLMPVVILMAVSLLTCAVILPISLFCGWI